MSILHGSTEAFPLAPHTAAIASRSGAPGEAPMINIIAASAFVNVCGIESLEELRRAIEWALASDDAASPKTWEA